MENLNNLRGRLNEFRNLFNQMKDTLPEPLAKEKDRIESLITFAEERFNGQNAQWISDAERNALLAMLQNTYNTFNIIKANPVPNSIHVNNAAQQINALKQNINNLIPSDDFSKAEIKRMTSELKQGKTTLDAEIEKVREQVHESSILLSRSMAIGLSQEFEKKRKNEIGGGKWCVIQGRPRLPTCGTYQYESLNFILALILIVLAFVLGEKGFEVIFGLNLSQMSGNSQIFFKVFTRIMLTVPFIWYAIVKNKKMNLSKKLAEEYWHKEIIAKTFLGMKHQIEKGTEGEAQRELRNELLRITLRAMAKNPADCIGNHEKSDNPVDNLLGATKDVANEVKDLADNKLNTVADILSK